MPGPQDGIGMANGSNERGSRMGIGDVKTYLLLKDFIRYQFSLHHSKHIHLSAKQR